MFWGNAEWRGLWFGGWEGGPCVVPGCAVQLTGLEQLLGQVGVNLGAQGGRVGVCIGAGSKVGALLWLVCCASW